MRSKRRHSTEPLAYSYERRRRTASTSKITRLRPRLIRLDPLKHRTGDHWHILVAGLPPVFRYGWRVDGPRGGGHRFNPELVLLDPSSTAIAGVIFTQQPQVQIQDQFGNVCTNNSTVTAARSGGSGALQGTLPL